MNTEDLDPIAAELRTMWPTIKIDLAWQTMLAQSTKGLTVEQVRAGIKDLFDEGRDYPPNLSQIVHTARFRSRQDTQQKVLPEAVGEANAGLRAYLESLGVASFKEAVAHEGRKRLAWDDEKVSRWLESKSIVKAMP